MWDEAVAMHFAEFEELIKALLPLLGLIGADPVQPFHGAPSLLVRPLIDRDIFRADVIEIYLTCRRLRIEFNEAVEEIVVDRAHGALV